MSTFSAVDLSRLPAPSAVEVIDFEVLFAEILADLRELDPVFDAVVESDPVYKILQVVTYREMLIRQRINDAVRSVLIAFATGSMLDHLGAFYGVTRLELGPGDAVLGTPRVMEDDEAFRRRIQLAPEGFSVAGPKGAYITHGLASAADVLDVAATSYSPGHVTIYVLSRVGNGTASEQLLTTVREALNGESIRPFCETVTVLSAAIVEYEIHAELVVYDGPDPEVVVAAARTSAQAYAEATSRINQQVTMSALYKALHQEGVERVNLTEPLTTIEIGEGQAARCVGIYLKYRTVGGG